MSVTNPQEEALSPEGEELTEASAEGTFTISPEEQVTALETKLEESTREASELRAMAQRLQADFVNFRRRSEQERDDMLKYFNSGLISKFLPLLDELSMALEHSPASSRDDSWIQGVRLIDRSFRALFEAEGVTSIEPTGKPFDPAEHEALGFQESTKYEEGNVAEVVRPGYNLNGRLLRPAQVILAKAPQASK